MDQSPPEMYSVALSGGNKFTAGFRRIPVTAADWQRVKEFLELLKDSVVGEDQVSASLRIGDQPEIPLTPTSNAARVLRGHVPTETELARASEKIALRQNAQWITATMEETRLQTIREKRASTNSSDESGESSQS